ncbi:MAG TPA: nucleotide exchange factor GrpE [Chloroflexota bacterium]|jgi:molecular chaperone GrpE|nr:nucleotide exchange factor GrpE [Chloroflexota bacterium]
MAEEQASPAPSSEPTADTELHARVAELEAELAKERDQATDYMKRWQYAQAEVANIRRRTQQERDDLVKFGIAPLAATLLEILDNFERAEQAIPPTLQSFTWISGVMLIHRQLEYLLQQHGLEAVAATGQSYDAAVHEALTQEHHESVAEGVVIAEVQRGYKLHGRLLRPALVRVSQGPAPAGSAAEPAGEQPEEAESTPGTVA